MGTELILWSSISGGCKETWQCCLEVLSKECCQRSLGSTHLVLECRTNAVEGVQYRIGAAAEGVQCKIGAAVEGVQSASWVIKLKKEIWVD